jgi:hypothetical protein
MERQLHTIAKGDRKIYKITDNLDEIVEAANRIGHPTIHENIYNNFTLKKSTI